jgi:hypothetical protein
VAGFAGGDELSVGKNRDHRDEAESPSLFRSDIPDNPASVSGFERELPNKSTAAQILIGRFWALLMFAPNSDKSATGTLSAAGAVALLKMTMGES